MRGKWSKSFEPYWNPVWKRETIFEKKFKKDSVPVYMFVGNKKGQDL